MTAIKTIKNIPIYTISNCAVVKISKPNQLLTKRLTIVDFDPAQIRFARNAGRTGRVAILKFYRHHGPVSHMEQVGGGSYLFISLSLYAARALRLDQREEEVLWVWDLEGSSHPLLSHQGTKNRLIGGASVARRGMGFVSFAGRVLFASVFLLSAYQE